MYSSSSTTEFGQAPARSCGSDWYGTYMMSGIRHKHTHKHSGISPTLITAAMVAQGGGLHPCECCMPSALLCDVISVESSYDCGALRCQSVDFCAHVQPYIMSFLQRTAMSYLCSSTAPPTVHFLSTSSLPPHYLPHNYRCCNYTASLRTHTTMSAQRDAISPNPNDGNRKRVCKACDRCRMKKSKCDGKQPCWRCKAGNVVCMFGERRSSRDRVHPKGYVHRAGNLVCSS